MVGFISFADKLSAWFGKTFGWLIILMTFGMSYEVLVRYVFNAPTPWALEYVLHHVWHVVHDGRGLYLVARWPCSR